MLEGINVVATPDSADSSYFIDDFSHHRARTPLSMFPSVANVRYQQPLTLFPEPSTETYFYQAPYGASQGTVQDPYLLLHDARSRDVLPQTSVASFDSSIRATQPNEGSWMSLSTVDLAQPPTVLPIIPQLPLPFQPPAPVSMRYWVEIPQKVYDLGRRQWNFRRSDSIPFSVNGFSGVNMQDALGKYFTGLDGRDDPVFQNTAGAISCRFLFPGYPPNRSTQVSTLGWRKNRVSITRSKVAFEVAKKLNQYLEDMVGHPMGDSVEKCWQIGEGFMHLKNMFLVRLVSVSKGSFQPEIWVMV